MLRQGISYFAQTLAWNYHNAALAFNSGCHASVTPIQLSSPLGNFTPRATARSFRRQHSAMAELSELRSTDSLPANTGDKANAANYLRNSVSFRDNAVWNIVKQAQGTSLPSAFGDFSLTDAGQSPPTAPRAELVALVVEAPTTATPAANRIAPGPNSAAAVERASQAGSRAVTAGEAGADAAAAGEAGAGAGAWEGLAAAGASVLAGAAALTAGVLFRDANVQENRANQERKENGGVVKEDSPAWLAKANQKQQSELSNGQKYGPADGSFADALKSKSAATEARELASGIQQTNAAIARHSDLLQTNLGNYRTEATNLKTIIDSGLQITKDDRANLKDLDARAERLTGVWSEQLQADFRQAQQDEGKLRKEQGKPLADVVRDLRTANGSAKRYDSDLNQAAAEAEKLAALTEQERNLIKANEVVRQRANVKNDTATAFTETKHLSQTFKDISQSANTVNQELNDKQLSPAVKAEVEQKLRDAQKSAQEILGPAKKQEQNVYSLRQQYESIKSALAGDFSLNSDTADMVRKLQNYDTNLQHYSQEAAELEARAQGALKNYQEIDRILKQEPERNPLFGQPLKENGQNPLISAPEKQQFVRTPNRLDERNKEGESRPTETKPQHKETAEPLASAETPANASDDNREQTPRQAETNIDRTETQKDMTEQIRGKSGISGGEGTWYALGDGTGIKVYDKNPECYEIAKKSFGRLKELGYPVPEIVETGTVEGYPAIRMQEVKGETAQQAIQGATDPAELRDIVRAYDGIANKAAADRIVFDGMALPNMIWNPETKKMTIVDPSVLVENNAGRPNDPFLIDEARRALSQLGIETHRDSEPTSSEKNAHQQL